MAVMKILMLMPTMPSSEYLKVDIVAVGGP
jgi:hypothetical protein